MYFIEYNEKNNSGEFISTFGPAIFNYINFNSINLNYIASYSQVRLETLQRNPEPNPDQTTVAGKTPKYLFDSKERRGKIEIKVKALIMTAAMTLTVREGLKSDCTD